MLKKLVLISSIVLLCSAMVGCELNQPRLKDDTNCARLKRQALYNATNPNYEASWVTNTQQDSLKQQMAKNNCN
jgi:hypothetical protein